MRTFKENCHANCRRPTRRMVKSLPPTAKARIASIRHAEESYEAAADGRWELNRRLVAGIRDAKASLAEARRDGADEDITSGLRLQIAEREEQNWPNFKRP